MSVQRLKARFVSGNTECAAWHYPGVNSACVVMAGGFAVTKEPATDKFAKRFSDAGFTVLAFDYRRLGESGGQPRLVQPVRDLLADWEAAIRFARTLPEVSPERIAIWGFSASGGHVFHIATRHPELAAAIAQTPNADGPATTRNAARHQTLSAMLRFTGIGILDAIGSLVGRPPRLVPLAGQSGTVAVLTTPDSGEANRAFGPDTHPDWQRKVAARSALRLGFYSPGRSAAQVCCPLQVVVCEQDQTALAAPAVRAAHAAPGAELVALPGGHYAPFLDAHEQVIDAELSFLRQHALRSAAAGSALHWANRL